MSSRSSSYVLCPEAIDNEDRPTVTAFSAFESQLKTLCLKEFPGGLGSWRADDLQTEERRRQLKDFKKTCLLDKHSVTLRAVTKKITEVDADLLRFRQLEDLTLTGNYIRQVNSRCLPRSLKTLELCVNEISDLTELCVDALSQLVHLGLGYNQLSTTDNHLHARHWPSLRSLDLSYNHLSDLEHLVSNLLTLPLLRNLVLYGNPFTLVPAYRAYTVDSLPRLCFLDDLPVTVDERLQFSGVSHDEQACDITSAKLMLSVRLLRGVLCPDDLMNPQDYPEYPKISRKYYVEYLFVTETASDQATVEHCSSKMIIHEGNTAAAAAVTQDEPSTLADRGSSLELVDRDVAVSSRPLTSPSGLPLTSVRSMSSEWTDEDMLLDWTQLITVRDLRLLRDFFVEGMTVNVVEQKILSYPAPVVESSDVILPESHKDSKTTVAGKTDKKESMKADVKPTAAAGNKAKKKGGGGSKKKAADQLEVVLVQSPPHCETLASFHVPLRSFADADFSPLVTTLTKQHPPPSVPGSPTACEVKKDKDKKAVASKKDAKKKDLKGAKDKKVSAGKVVDDGVERPHALEVVDLSVTLCLFDSPQCSAAAAAARDDS